MCGPSEYYPDNNPFRICDFCKEQTLKSDLHEISQPMPPFGVYESVFLCPKCYKPYSDQKAGIMEVFCGEKYTPKTELNN